MPPPPRAALLVLLALLVPARGAPDVVAWNVPADRQPYQSRTGTVGDVVRFEYGGGHNVVLHPSGDCDATDGVRLGSSGPTEFKFEEAGEFTFACDVSDGLHCGLGQIITYTIVDAAVASSSAPSSAASSPPPASSAAPPSEAAPAEPPAEACVWCPGGLTAEPGSLIPGGGGFTCGQVAGLAPTATVALCAQAEPAQAFCCPGDVASAATAAPVTAVPDGTCDFCPGGMTVAPDSLIPGGGGFTCGQAEAVATTASGALCAQVQEAGAFCCPTGVADEETHEEPNTEEEKEEKEEEKEVEEKEEGGEKDEDEEGSLVSEGQDLSVEADVSDEVLASYSEFFNPGEEMGLLEFRIKPYKIPDRTTMYVDFVFNIPEHVGELVHIVVGDVIVSQPRHLHHFVLTGCTEPIDPALEGLPTYDKGCAVPLGGGWASGGDFFGGIPRDGGAAFGAGLGIRALNLNVHYTDGTDPDPDRPTQDGRALATDGFRLLYTPVPRPRTVLYKAVINVGGNTREMRIPPAVPRYFYTKTCTVEPACMDTSDARMEEMYTGFTCGQLEGECDGYNAEGNLYLQLLCPVACGACDDGQDRSGDGYHVASVNYHAHLIGREMYTTLRPNATRAVPVDLASQDLWIYDFQVSYPLADEALRVYPGDQIQATCVYDSSGREDDTFFDLSTYDEMCITQLAVLVDTPAVDADAGASLQARLHGLSFNCAVDDASAIWGGALEAGEDGREVWQDHPAAEADCTFPVGQRGGQGLSLSGDAIPTFEARCKTDPDAPTVCDGGDVFDAGAVLETNMGGTSISFTCQQAEDLVLNGPYGNGVGQEELENMRVNEWQPKCCTARTFVVLCDGGDTGTVLDAAAVAGEYCNGGSLNGADSNDEAEGSVAFQEKCAGGGGTSEPYTCQFLEEYGLGLEAEEWEETRVFFQPKCCTAQEQDGAGTFECDARSPCGGTEFCNFDGGANDGGTCEGCPSAPCDRIGLPNNAGVGDCNEKCYGEPLAPTIPPTDETSATPVAVTTTATTVAATTSASTDPGAGTGLNDTPGDLSSDGNIEEPTSGSLSRSSSLLFLLFVVACFVATL